MSAHWFEIDTFNPLTLNMHSERSERADPEWSSIGFCSQLCMSMSYLDALLAVLLTEWTLI